MATTAALPRTTAPRRLYVGLAVLAAVIAVVGFWPTYFGPLVAGIVDKAPIIHFHAAVYVGWLAIFITQAVLAATGRVAAHMKLGRFAIGYGVLVIVVGLLTAFARFAVRVRAGEVVAAAGAAARPAARHARVRAAVRGGHLLPAQARAAQAAHDRRDDVAADRRRGTHAVPR